jgi:hypothetical protein
MKKTLPICKKYFFLTIGGSNMRAYGGGGVHLRKRRAPAEKIFPIKGVWW